MKFHSLIVILGEAVELQPHVSLEVDDVVATLTAFFPDVEVHENCVIEDEGEDGDVVLKDGFLHIPKKGTPFIRPDVRRTSDVYVVLICPVDLLIKSSGQPVPLIANAGDDELAGLCAQVWRVCNGTSLRFSFGNQMDYIVANLGGDIQIENVNEGETGTYQDTGVTTHPEFCFTQSLAGASV